MNTPEMACRPGCGACCIAPSMSSPIPGLPEGKPAGLRCPQLTEDNLCRLFGDPARPAVCVNLRPNLEMCGRNAAEALAYLAALEAATAPARKPSDLQAPLATLAQPGNTGEPDIRA